MIKLISTHQIGSLYHTIKGAHIALPNRNADLARFLSHTNLGTLLDCDYWPAHSEKIYVLYLGPAVSVWILDGLESLRAISQAVVWVKIEQVAQTTRACA